MLKTLFSTALIASMTEALRVGVVSDMHTNLHYDSLATDSNCVATSNERSYTSSFDNSDNAPLARIGCDPSTTLVDYMLRRFNEVFPDVDVILVTGDHVAHKVAPHYSDGSATEA